MTFLLEKLQQQLIQFQISQLIFFFFFIDLFVNGLIVAETATGNYETILENEQTGQTYFL